MSDWKSFKMCLRSIGSVSFNDNYFQRFNESHQENPKWQNSVGCFTVSNIYTVQTINCLLLWFSHCYTQLSGTVIERVFCFLFL